MIINGSLIGIVVIAVLAIIVLSVFFTFVPVALWISAISAGVRVSILTLVGMRLRRVIPSRVVNPLIKAHKAGVEVTINQLESHYLAGGNVDRVVNALIAAQRANIELTFERAAAIDLAGRDVLQAVQMSVNPKVIETPFIAGVAMNGIEVKAKARITVRANIDRLVGGAGEETIVARVGEGIVSTIGSSINHAKVLENPDLISQTVLTKGLDSGTAFEILSIDIADVDIGKNIGAELQTEQAQADKNIAQAKAEERRAMAVASEQEMKAKVVEMRSKVVEAEAEVPLAMAEALRTGNIGVMDYMNYKNIQADTGMRDSIGKVSGSEDQNDKPKKLNSADATSRKGDVLMEQIIILIAIGLLSTLFNKKNKGEAQKQKQEASRTNEVPQNQPIPQRQPMPQRSQAPQARQASSSEQMDPFKRLKELTGEIYKEIQEDQRKAPSEQQNSIEPFKIPEVPVQRPEISQTSRPSRKASDRSSGRLSMHNPEQQMLAENEFLHVDITNKRDVLKGIVFSEILGPPKSKR